ncbi:MAG: TolC family protein [Pseudomonadales bacterium]|nr:TolC family protein [Pseudomonadales bacterium]
MKGYFPTERHINAVLGCALGFLFFTSSMQVAAELSIENAQQLAVLKDAGINQILYRSNAMKEDAGASAQLPDPTLVLGAQNFPTDTFKFDQEPMTQLKVGLRQMFPQGDTLSLLEMKMNIMASSMESMAQARYLSVTRMVRKNWLEVLYWQHAQDIIEEDKVLFNQLIDVTRSLYSIGKVQQQDVLRAELESSRLDEKLIKAIRQGETERAGLARWIGRTAMTESWPSILPILLTPKDIVSSKNPDEALIIALIAEHPELVSLQQDIAAAERDIKLAKQKYQPLWGVELNYGYRGGKNMDGSDRSDFVSAMVNVSLPLFTTQRQDRSVKSATLRKEALKSSYQDKVYEMVGMIQTLSRRLMQTEEQLQLFEQSILSKARLQAEASLNAYQADAADFAEVMRAFLREQKDRLDYERLRVTRLQLLSELQYYVSFQTPKLGLTDPTKLTGVSQ